MPTLRMQAIAAECDGLYVALHQNTGMSQGFHQEEIGRLTQVNATWVLSRTKTQGSDLAFLTEQRVKRHGFQALADEAWERFLRTVVSAYSSTTVTA